MQKWVDFWQKTNKLKGNGEMGTLFSMGGKIGTMEIAGNTAKPDKLFFQISKVLLNKFTSMNRRSQLAS